MEEILIKVSMTELFTLYLLGLVCGACGALLVAARQLRRVRAIYLSADDDSLPPFDGGVPGIWKETAR